MDLSLMGVALPAIGRDLSLSEGTLQWLVSGYAVTYGGFVSGAAFPQRGSQLGVAPLDLVAGDPCGLVAGVQEPGSRTRGQFRRGGEGGVLVESGTPAPGHRT